jgi:hypothetical protein
MNLRLTLAASVAALAVAAPASTASASASADVRPLPDINCGIVSCTYQVERIVDSASHCVDGAVRFVEYAINSTPQPQECSLG